MNPIDFDSPAPQSVPPSKRSSILERRWRKTPQRRICISLFSLAILLMVIAGFFHPNDQPQLATWTLPELSNDLNRIAFVCTTHNGSDVYVGVPPDYLTHTVHGSPPGAIAVAWVLGGKKLLVTTDRNGSEKEKLWLLTADQGPRTALSPDDDAAYRYPVVSPSGKLVAYSSNERTPGSFDVYLLDCETLQRRKVVESSDNCFAVSFSPDETRLCVRHEHDAHDSDIELVDLATGKSRRLTPHEGKADYSNCVWSTDGSTISLITNQTSEFKTIGTIDLREARPHIEITPSTDGDVTSISSSRDGRYSATTVLRHGMYDTWIQDSKERRRVPLPFKARVYRATFTADSAHVLLDTRGPQKGSTRFLVDLKTMYSIPVGWERPIHRDAIRPRWVRYHSSDGTAVNALLYIPRGAKADGTLPFIVMFHGGPASVWLPFYNQSAQHYLARGYGILAPNIRGSTGQGRTWSEADDQLKRPAAFEDGAAAAHWLIDSKWADPRKVVAMGASYGGYMTLCMLAFYPRLFAAGVDGMGMSDMPVFLKHLRPWARADRVSEYGDPVKDEAFLRGISPVFTADRIRAPLLIIHGANDPRVPIEQSEEMVSAIRNHHGIVEYKVLRDEGHGWTDPGDFVTDVDTTTAFLDKYVVDRK